MELLLLTADPDPASVLPALRLLPHRVGTAVPDRAAVPEAGPHDAVLVDARTDLLGARAMCQLRVHVRDGLGGDDDPRGDGFGAGELAHLLPKCAGVGEEEWGVEPEDHAFR